MSGSPDEDRTGSETPPDDDTDWRFGTDDVDEDGIVEPPIEPGSPDPENVAFVLLGVVVAVGLLVDVVV